MKNQFIIYIIMLCGIIYATNIYSQIAGSLPVKITTNPVSPSNDKPIKIKAEITNGITSKIRWIWKVNKNANDLEDYVDQPDKYQSFDIESSESCEITINRENAGIYRVYLFAYNESNTLSQYEKTFYITVDLPTDPCLQTFIRDRSECEEWDGYELAVGSKLRLASAIYYEGGHQSMPTESQCYTRSYYVNGTTLYYPKYDGVESLQWTMKKPLNTAEIVLSGDSYNSTQYNHISKYDYYYGAKDVTQCIPLEREGDYVIYLKVRGGYFDNEPGSGDIKYPLQKTVSEINQYTSVAKRSLKAIDCSTQSVISSVSHFGLYDVNGSENKSPNLVFTVGLDVGEERHFIGRNQVILKPGFYAKQGSTFSVKTIPCPPLLDCGCSNSRSNYVERLPEDEMVNVEKSLLDGNFIVYPNPTNGPVTVSCTNDMYIDGIQITDLSGKLLMNIKDVGEASKMVDISHFSPGMYILKTFVGEEEIVNKIILQP
ncbi:MAG: T9SS type A sorting domain-containing protein [Bacteroidales bacterium]|nr:T9SS type A sorting domain-containing protein [Bacteroidales bacterium]